MHRGCTTVTLANAWATGGRDGHVRQRDALRGGQAAVDLHLPRLSARTPSDAPQLTADFEQEVGQPQRLQRLRTMVDREALGDAGKIERNTAWLRQRNIGRIESQPMPADLRTGFGERLSRRQAGFIGLGAEAPASDQRAHRRIDRTATGGCP